ncbi:signal peptidase I [Blastococcus sp. CT_GayMR20]|uniref:signal peptidase I n=1 Tax=Blastococcus sp. CT_GayMR20 TaxID=2559609 RepID=UPI0010749CFD|nr:signal peptidase I [Blastococcus sp. CT_GayMR20]TFV90185.1 signal peptidase I [Blastococcus sp. CT_GayMR20]TFV90210.1 signal peptidase I [Blastococcus sp. CT_GayMR20]
MNAASRVAGISAVIALVLTTVWLFWPAELGGGTTYVSTHGTSMEPEFTTGDLAVLSPAETYAVGDVVAYYSNDLETIVMHRIVSGDADGFVTQGDNNDWLDEERPTADEILGRLFLRIPQGGEVLDALRSPGLSLPMAGVVLALLGATARRPRARRHLRALRGRVSGLSLSDRVRSLPVAARASTPTRARARQVALGAGAVTILAAVGCGVLLALPPTQTDTRTLQVHQQGEFAYTGEAEPGTTYPDGTVATGETVWTSLVRNLTVSLTSTVTGPDLAGLGGGMRLDVVVTAADGWSAVLTSGGVAALQGGTATASVAVDTDEAEELLTRHYDEIGVTGGSATLTVTPVTDLTGTVEGIAFAADPLPGLVFALEDMSLRPAATEAAAFATTVRTEVQTDEVVPRSLTVLGVSVPIGAVRTAVGAALLAALVTLGAAAWVGRVGRGDVADSFLVRHADRILPVSSFSPGPTVIDVSDAESLHRVAERFDTVVLHHAGPDEDVFAVRDLDATYRFVVPGASDRRRGRPPVPPSVVPPDTTAPVGKAVMPDGALWGRVA